MAGQRIAVMFPALILAERRGIFNVWLHRLSIFLCRPCGADVLRGCRCDVVQRHPVMGVCNMTREESLEALCVAFEKLDEDEQRGMIRLIVQMKRAHTFGLDVRFDEHTFTFFIADAATNTVVAPPPMNIPTVEAWLDDYEKSGQKNDTTR